MNEPRNLLISGASRGIGRALAEHYLERGERVIGCSRGESDLQHANYLHVSTDVTDTAAVQQLFRTIRTHANRLDVVINNAGAGKMLPLALTPADVAKRLMEINYLGTFLLTTEAIRLLRKSPAARIVNMSSVAVPLRLEGEAAYASAKAAVEALTRITAKELGPFGITCNAIGPTPIRTDLIRHVPEDKLQALIDRQSIRKWATVDDVVHLIDFLIHPASRMITGQILYLGGIG